MEEQGTISEISGTTNNDGLENKAEDNVYKERRLKGVETATKKILSDLGVSSVDDIKNKFDQFQKLQGKYEKLEGKLNEIKLKEANSTKRALIIKKLEELNVFDPDALANYVELNEITLNDQGEIEDLDQTVESLKQRKPNFFPKEDKLLGDTHKKSNPNSLVHNPISYSDQLHNWMQSV